ncbi:MAG: hypothetical protein U1E27_06650 [Kiritimatiellia bacterium]|nr:hypothetical protein [Kiritimatiellia bacterium]
MNAKSGWRIPFRRWPRRTVQGIFPLALFFFGLSSMSQLRAEEPLRNPFWPVGYRPAARPGARVTADPKTAAEQAALEAVRLEQAWGTARARLVIQGISRVGDTRAIALINGKATEAGETVSLALDGMVFRWRIKAIDLSGVDLERVDVRQESTK